MRVAYLCYWNVFAPSGVATKIQDQLESWRRLGHQVTLHCISPAGRRGEPPVLNGNVYCFGNPLTRVVATTRALRAIRALDPDVVYIREDTFIPPPQAGLKKIPTVVEVNGTILTSYGEPPTHGLTNRLRFLAATSYARWCQGHTTRYAAGLVAPDPTLLASVPDRPPHSTVVPNSIQRPDVSTRRVPTDRPAFVYLAGTRMPGQGLDKLPALAEAMPDWDIHVAGLDREQLALHVPPNIVKHPLLAYEEFRSLLERSDVGLSTLALHRKGMEESTPLKTRMYLAHGLPTIVPYLDTAFPPPAPWYILQIPNNETNIAAHTDAIRAFAESVRGKRVEWSEVEGRIGAQALEDQRMRFVAESAGLGSPTVAKAPRSSQQH